jgi:hypothetical protein
MKLTSYFHKGLFRKITINFILKNDHLLLAKSY